MDPPANKSTLDIALEFISEGVSFIPIQPGSKRPAFELLPIGGDGKPIWSPYTERLPTEKEATRWFSSGKYGIAMVCGGVSGNLLIFDFDQVKAAKKWAAKYRSLVGGAPIVKPSRGWHLWIRTDQPVHCRRGDGYDLKGERSYVLSPPSIHPSGIKYELVKGDLAKIPVIEAELLGPGPGGGDGKGKPEGWQDGLLKNVPEGARHTRMVQLCGRWYGKGLNEQEVLSVAYGVNTRWTKPLPEKELTEIVRTLKQTHDRKHPLAGPGIPVKDYGHASVLAQHFTGRLRWAPHRGKWMNWDGKVWKLAEEEWVAKQAADTLRKEYAAQLGGAKDKYAVAHLLSLVKETCTYARVIAALSFLKGWDGILTRTEEWDADPWVLNCLSGIIDLHTKHLSKHDPDRLITKMTPVVFNPEAPGDGWQEHLKLFLPDEAVRRQVQRDLGVSLVGTDIVEMLPIWLGGGLNGKTTTAKVLRKILGDYVGEAAPNLLIQTKFERHPTELADLAGRRIVFSSEVGQGKRLDEEIVKRLTGGDVKKGRFMRGDFFDIEQTFTIFMIVNHRPGISGTDHAIWRRVRLIPWTVQIPEAKKLPQDEIVDSLVAEGSAVLSWLLAGLADWQQDRGWMAPEVKAVTAAYRAEQDRLGAFLQERCEEGVQFTVKVGKLHETYTLWCAEVGETSLGKTAFGKRLRERGMTSKKSGDPPAWTWFGLRLTSPDVFSIYPIENDQGPNKQEKTSGLVSKTEQVVTEKGDKQSDLDLQSSTGKAKRLKI